MPCDLSKTGRPLPGTEIFRLLHNTCSAALLHGKTEEQEQKPPCSVSQNDHAENAGSRSLYLLFIITDEGL